jgi:hypothetical protein
MLKGTSALLSSWGRMGACGYADRTPLHVTYRGDHTEETIQRRAQARPRALPTETKVESGTSQRKSGASVFSSNVEYREVGEPGARWSRRR